jgi:hypothetical protein
MKVTGNLVGDNSVHCLAESNFPISCRNAPFNAQFTLFISLPSRTSLRRLAAAFYFAHTV